MQLVGLKVPVLLVENVTVPVGVPKPEVTVAVQLVGVLSRTLDGEHDTLVLLAAGVAVRVNVPLAPVCVASPL